MALKLTQCPDCSYPPNFIITALAKDDYDDEKQRYDIRCRDCGDFWIEIEEEE